MARAQRRQLVFTKWHDKRDVAFLSTNVSPDKPSRLVPRIRNRQNVNIETEAESFRSLHRSHGRCGSC